jgi:hypothetical protein
LINLGFILREDLLLCSSYLPLGVPNWAVIYTPSVIEGSTTPIGLVCLPVTFGTRDNYRTESLNFDVAYIALP